MKFALVSADKSHGVRFWINPEEGDATSFMNWVHVMDGFHFNFLKLREDMSILKDFDVVMMSGHPYHLVDIKTIGDYLKPTNTITMFYPEGSLQLYDGNIDKFHSEIYDAWNSCDIVSAAEEDKISYYQAFIRGDTIARFIHVPLRDEMELGQFFVPRIYKNVSSCLIYGDNNPNHPMVAIACAANLGMDVIGVDINRGKMQKILNLFPNTRFYDYTKIAQYPFLRLLSRCFLTIYPTEWIGTARYQIAAAVCGTPCIGNHDSHTQRRLFPDLGTDIYDIEGMCGLAKKLKYDPEFYKYVCNKAFENVKFYGLNSTLQRFSEAVTDARRIKEKNRCLTATFSPQETVSA